MKSAAKKIGGCISSIGGKLAAMANGAAKASMKSGGEMAEKLASTIMAAPAWRSGGEIGGETIGGARKHKLAA